MTKNENVQNKSFILAMRGYMDEMKQICCYENFYGAMMCYHFELGELLEKDHIIPNEYKTQQECIKLAIITSMKLN